MKHPKIYFPNLNGLRFIAAMMVIIHHIEFIKTWFNVSNSYNVPSIEIIGKLGVILFFVLSGFLITYLLLAEEHTFCRINIRKFYLRRVLRIWPLYFLIIILALYIIPHFHIFALPIFDNNPVINNVMLFALLYATFFPNLGLAFFGNTSYAAHTWSIGTEEQYYLLWPIVLRFFKKNRLVLMFCVILSYLLIAFILNSKFSDSLPYKNNFILFWSSFNIDCMAIGGIFAIILYEKLRFLPLILNNYLFYFVIILLLLLIGKGVYIPWGMHYEFYAVLFGITILNFAANPHIKLSLEYKPLHFLGKISYGLYMYHPICIVFCLKALFYFKIYNTANMYLFCIVSIIVIATLSYLYFESFFIKMKSKYTDIISGDNAKKTIV